jgi:hypothetical protein
VAPVDGRIGVIDDIEIIIAFHALLHDEAELLASARITQ